LVLLLGSLKAKEFCKGIGSVISTKLPQLVPQIISVCFQLETLGFSMAEQINQ